MQFDSDVPMPKKRTVRGAFAGMNVGDSFIAGPDKPHGTLYSFARRKGWKVARRVQPDGTIRIWRIA